MSQQTSEPATEYFRESNEAFEIVVRHGTTDPTEYDQDDIRQRIDRYTAVTSLGDVHKSAIEEIKELLEKYKEDHTKYPQTKGYGIVGQYGDGKTHFLFHLVRLCREESDLLVPEDLSILTIDPFHFTEDPGDIVRAVRERVRIDLGSDAADRIPQVASNEQEEIRERISSLGNVDQDDLDEELQEYTIRRKDGKGAGRSFVDGVKSVAQSERIDAIVIPMDEIEGIFRGKEASFEDLDRYRQFFDEIIVDVPVLFLITAPRDQWAKFENIHDGFMSRGFGAPPRQHVNLQTLNESELANTWKQRRNEHLLKEDKKLPSKYQDELFPIHQATLRAISACARRANSNRTAINLLENVFEDFLKGNLQWISPGKVFEEAVTGAGAGFLNPKEHEQILENDEEGILTSIAGTLDKGIGHKELKEILEVTDDYLESRINALKENAWIEKFQRDGGLYYELTGEVLNSLITEGHQETPDEGEVVRVVESVMANIATDSEILQRNLAEILKETELFEDIYSRDIQSADHTFVVNSNFRKFYDRDVIVTAGSFAPVRLEEIRAAGDAELVVTIDYEEYDYESDRVLAYKPTSYDQQKAYETEGLEYSLRQWICAYTRLRDELPSGAHRLLRSIERWVATDVIGEQVYDFEASIHSRLESLYPTYPKPTAQMNSNARSTYESLIKNGRVGEVLTWEDIEEYAPASSEQAINNYMDDWEQFRLAIIDHKSSPKTAELKISPSEQLILDAIDESGGISKQTLYSDMRDEGYPKDDVDTFVELLKTRGRIRVENGNIVQTQRNRFIATQYFEAIKEVAEWLTHDDLPTEFKEDVLPNRDDIVGSLKSCEKQYQDLKQAEEDVEGHNPVEQFIENVSELRGECAIALDSLENTQYAQALAKAQENIEELREAGPKERPSSNQFTILVSDLNQMAGSLANGARRSLETLTDTEGTNVFTQLQELNEFTSDLWKIGPYDDHASEEEINEKRVEFRDLRPDVALVTETIETIHRISADLSLAKRVVNLAIDVSDNLLAIEEFNVEKYDIEEEIDHPLAEDARIVGERLDEATDKHRKVGEKITSLSFGSLDDDRIEALENEARSAADELEAATEKGDQVDDQVEDRVQEINDTVQSSVDDVDGLVSDYRRTTIESIRIGEIREDATAIYSDLTDQIEEILEAANNVQNRFPGNVTDLAAMEEAFDQFETERSSLEEFAATLEDIEERYYQTTEDEMAEGLHDEIEAERDGNLPNDIVDRIDKLFERISQITEAITINIPPIRDRIAEITEADGPVSLDKVATSVPRDETNETPQEVIAVLGTMIKSEDLELGYTDRVVVR